MTAQEKMLRTMSKHIVDYASKQCKIILKNI